MGVRERMEQLHEEMMERRKIEVKTLREWLSEDGYVPPEHPADRWAEIDKLVDRLSTLGVIVEYPDHLTDCEVYTWLLAHLNGHVMLPRDRYVPLEPIDRRHEEEHLIHLAYDEESR